MPEYAVDVDDSREVYLINLSTSQLKMEKLRLLKNTLLVVLLFVAIFVLVILGWHVLLLIQHQQAIVKQFTSDEQIGPQVSQDLTLNFTTSRTPIDTMHDDPDDNYDPINLAEEGTTDPASTTSTTSNPNDWDNSQKQNTIKRMTKSAWNAYVRYALGHDSLNTATRAPMNHWFGPGSGHTIVASLDTLWIMGLQEEYGAAKRWIEANLTFGAIDKDVLVYMSVSQYLGGLLASFALSREEVFLDKANEIAQLLEPAYNTTTGLPYERFNPKTGSPVLSSKLSTSSLGAQQLEYHYLSSITINPDLYVRTEKMRKAIQSAANQSRLTLSSIDVNTENWIRDRAVLWANSLPKEYLQSGGQDTEAIQLFDELLDSAQRKEMFAISRSGLLFVREYNTTADTYENSMSYANCYLGTMLTLGAYSMQQALARNVSLTFNQRQVQMDRINRYFQLGEQLVETCHAASSKTKTGLGPARFYFNERDDATNSGVKNKHNVLSHELAEAYFIMWRMTHHPKYRDYAWQMVQSIQEHCITQSGAYSAIKDVNQVPTQKLNYQRAFILSGTFKYLYLIFEEDSVLPLDKWVFNSAGHPFPICGKHETYPERACVKA